VALQAVKPKAASSDLTDVDDMSREFGDVSTTDNAADDDDGEGGGLC